MDAISYEYTKQRKQFGLHPAFADSSLPIETIPPEPLTPPPQPYDPADPASQYTPLSPLSPSSQPPPQVQRTMDHYAVVYVRPELYTGTVQSLRQH